MFSTVFFLHTFSYLLQVLTSDVVLLLPFHDFLVFMIFFVTFLTKIEIKNK